jgi:PAS domain-containing protein
MTKLINWTILGHRLMYMLKASETFDNLGRSETKNRALINAIPDAMFQIDRQGLFLDFKAALDIDLLVKPEEVTGKRVSEVLREELADKVTEAMDMTPKRANTGHSNTAFPWLGHTAISSLALSYAARTRCLPLCAI